MWIVESRVTLPKDAKWVPCVHFPGIPGVYFTRATARAAAKKMFSTNRYNNEKWVTCRYRVSKYIPFSFDCFI